VSGPNSNPAVSATQNYRTPRDLLFAVQRKFGVRLAFDIACDRENAVAPQGFYYPEHDALASAWPTLGADEAAWCNPQFNRSSAFARVASESPHCRTLMLVPASVGTNWWAEYVAPFALVAFLRPRIVFLNPDGSRCEAGINRDCALLAYGWQPGVHVYEDWRKW
jgi:phage N-6-adenine-methyltransferase